MEIGDRGIISLIILYQFDRLLKYLPMVQKSVSIGPSVVRALPLAAGRNKGGHYFRYIILPDISCAGKRTYPAQNPPLFKTTEGVVVGFQIFAWAPK